MHILVINCGSSSIKGEVIDTDHGRRLLKMRAERVNEATPQLSINDGPAEACASTGHAAVLELALQRIRETLGDTPLHGIGHRVVHGGEAFSAPVRITDEVEARIEALNPLAPLHQPANLAGIRAARLAFPGLPHIAVFDTAFHHTLPNRARHYALPQDLRERHGIRRYGFHGPSHAFVSKAAARYMDADVRDLRLITCHLGNGASIAAVEYGRSVETSMGMTPLEGLVMGTRSGDLDPGIMIRLMQAEGWSAAELDQVLNSESGLKGLSGQGNDMRDIIDRASKGDEQCRLALQVFSHRVRKYIGAYAAVMDGVDAIVMTGGIGENSPVVRERCTQRLSFMGALIDEDLNRDLVLSREAPVQEYSTRNSRVRLLAVATDEQAEIAEAAASLVRELDRVNQQLTIPIAISARHVHLTQETVEQLFGEGYHLTERNPLSQPGQFACHETVTLVGPKNRLEHVRILGPTRGKNQVEISRTDEFFLGIDAPVRASGHIENTPGIVLEGPAGTVTLTDGLICAWRHIHMTPEDADRFEVKDKDIVEVEVQSDQRSLIFGNVLVRVSPKYKLEMHIDTDEGNAAEITTGAAGALVAAQEGAGAFLRRKKV